METGQLHQLINQMEWSQVLHVIRNDPSARSAAKELFRENAPLHTACEKKAPEIVLIELLELNADALQHVGKGGTLPLHIAAQKNLGPKVIEKMIRLYPAALDYKNIANYTPREYEQKDPLASQALNR
jgi:ankyrin repeat protein